MKQENLQRSKFWFKVAVSIILILSSILINIPANKKIGPAGIGVTQIKTAQDKKEKSDLPSCGNKMDLFTVSPVKSDDYGPLIPLGNLNPTGHVFSTDHIYFFSKQAPEDGKVSKSLSKTLYSPGDMWIIAINTSKDMNTGVADYAIDYQPCAEFVGKFGHVGTISTKLERELEKIKEIKCDEYETGGSKFRHCRFDQLKIFVKAGEELGTVFDGRSAALDLWSTDYRVNKIGFANPSRWREESFYNVCPANYFVENIKKEMLGRFSDFDDNNRVIEPICGTIDVDIKGTAKGYWFTRDHTLSSTEDKNMALVNSNLNPKKQAFSMGTSGESKGFKSGVTFFTPKNDGYVDRDFAEVKPDGNVYCYETVNSQDENIRDTRERSVVYLTMPDSLTVRVEKTDTSACNKGPWVMKNYIEFVR